MSLSFDSDELLKNITSSIDESDLLNIFAYYAKHKILPMWILQILLDCVKNKDINSRPVFLVNILLSDYFLQHNNFDLAETHIKYCIEYLNNNININEYENMVSYIICGLFLEKTMDIFSSPAINYYSMSIEIAENLNDEISLASVLTNVCYYYHKIEDSSNSVLFGNKALEIVRELNQPVLYINLYKTLALIRATIGNYEEASQYMKKTIEVSQNIKDFSMIEHVKLQNTLGYIYYLEGNFKEALSVHLNALKALSFVSNASDILDEAIKTFDNLSTSFKMLGDIEKALDFSEITTMIIKNCNYGHRINDIHNLCKQYTDLGLIYGLYLKDYENALNYYNLARLIISKEDHYIKLGNLTVLEAYIQYHSGDILNSEVIFERAIDLLQKHGSKNIYVQQLLLSYYISFARRFSSKTSEYMAKAFEISKEFCLNKHYNFFVDLFIRETSFLPCDFNVKNYPINLIQMLSEERRHSLAENKKARDFELIQDFSNKISTIVSEKILYEVVQKLFNNYFLSKGFMVINRDFSGQFKSRLHLKDIAKHLESELTDFFQNFIITNSLPVNYYEKGYEIYNFAGEDSNFVKSMIIYFLYDEITCSTYYFILFHDRKSQWLFSNEHAEVGLILIKNLFFKIKALQYTDNIRKDSLIDYATGLYNAKYMWNKLDELINEFNTSNQQFSMSVIDLNDFKGINDTYGHSVGDEVLKHFSKILKSNIENNYIIRYGGDEFIIFFPNITKFQAKEKMIEINNLCKSTPFTFNGIKIYIRFSYGIDNYSGHFSSSKDFFNSVDKQMYDYKITTKKEYN
jgi:diguanylate cyclase (GGDEF)-like protein